MNVEIESRWIVITADGGHVSVGRARALDQATIDQASNALRRQGLVGWLACLGGDYYGSGPVSVEMLQPLAGAAAADWPAVLSAFLSRRAASAVLS
jgi:hypothetical protein